MKQLMHKLRYFTDHALGQILLISVVVIGSHLNILFSQGIENPDGAIIYSSIDKIGSFGEYLNKLIAFQTIDLQPIRDLTFFIELFLHQSVGFTFTVFINCLIWIFIIYQLMRITEYLWKSYDRLQILLVLLIFSIHPIFSQSINWGAARKHLLAAGFILIATRYFFTWLDDKHRFEFRIIVLYTLSILSLPVSILWPVWAFFVLILKKEKLNQRLLKLFIPLFTIMLIVTALNLAYYKTSEAFLSIYPQKLSEFSIPNIANHIGMHFSQILLPTDTGFFYTTGPKVWISFFLFAALIVFLLLKHRSNKLVLIWLGYAAIHFVVFLSSANIYYDTYVIPTAISLLFILLTLLKGNFSPLRFTPFVLIPLFLYGTWSLNQIWKSPVEFFKNSFENHPRCSNAIEYGIKVYVSGNVLPNDLYEFIQTNQCIGDADASTIAKMVQHYNFEALQLIFEDEVDFNYRLNRFKELSQSHIYPMALYLVFLAKYEMPKEMREACIFINEKTKGEDLKFSYDPIFAKYVPPFLAKNPIEECKKFLSFWQLEPTSFY